MDLVFFGTGDIALPTLRHLLVHPRHKLRAVITQPDKPAGRQLILTPPETKKLALEHGVPVHQPERIRSFLPELAAIPADVYVVMAYGQILPKALLEMPRVACINLHASLLPRHRGAAPIQAAILAGEAESGITVMYIDVGLDSGDILLEKRLPLDPQETGGTLHDKLALLGPDALEEALTVLEAGHAPRLPQDHASATHQGKLTRESGILDWSQPAVDLERRIRAFDPWPGTATRMPNGKVLKVFPPVEILPTSGEPGSVLSAGADGLVIACGSGALRLGQVQAEGKKRMAARDYLSGNSLGEGRFS
jgi:methionyl-tRNA formyltransferase